MDGFEAVKEIATAGGGIINSVRDISCWADLHLDYERRNEIINEIREILARPEVRKAMEGK